MPIDFVVKQLMLCSYSLAYKNTNDKSLLAMIYGTTRLSKDRKRFSRYVAGTLDGIAELARHHQSDDANDAAFSKGGKSI
ncbi:MAG: hypothetical protein MRY32_08240 [Rickettsiales bacterium]|nr:hypothetical protein [Rickettsiales bacterium]